MSAMPAAQWRQLMSWIPRLPNGKPNLSAPAPMRADGRPDITGLWKPGAGYVSDIAKGLKCGDVPFQPWAKAL
jgi:hypothetical protein